MEENLDIHDQTTDAETDTEIETNNILTTTDAEGSSESDAESQANAIPNLNRVLFVDENQVNYYLMYFYEFFNQSVNEVILIPDNTFPSEDFEEIGNLHKENLYQYYFITSIEEREG